MRYFTVYYMSNEGYHDTNISSNGYPNRVSLGEELMKKFGFTEIVIANISELSREDYKSYAGELNETD